MKKLIKSIRTIAALKDGPVGEVLDKNWNTIHDIEDQLSDAAHSYDVASSYHGKVGEQEAKSVLNEINNVVKKLNELSKEFEKLAREESIFIKKYGHPDVYSENIRKEIYPR